MFSKTIASVNKPSITLSEILKYVTPDQILFHYTRFIPSRKKMISPFREDKHPSFMVDYSRTTGKLVYNDFGGEGGNYIDLCMKLSGMTYEELIEDIWKDIEAVKKNPKTPNKFQYNNQSQNSSKHYFGNHSDVVIKVRVRQWTKEDANYWKQFGIPLGMLDYYTVLPIDYFWINGMCFKTEPLAYDYIEQKDNIITHKIYQPLVKDKSRKWFNTHTADVISLWTRLNPKGDMVILAASLKDALTIRANMGIDVIALQGEGYIPSNTVIRELKGRFKRVIILYDNDKPGLEHAESLAQATGFENIILPQFEGGKDIAEMYVAMGSLKFKETLSKLLKL